MLSVEKLITMLDMQDELNKAVNPDWMAAGYPWHRAIMVESIEALEHYGWKWWKKQTPDLAQARMELVDIWHFMLSMALENSGGDRIKTAWMMNGLFYVPEKPTDKGTVVLFDLLAGYAAEGKICIPAFIHLMLELDLSWDQLYTLYVGKNVLNKFRQAHGYKDGTYRKDWDGMEDNVWLSLVMDSNPGATPEQLYSALNAHYDTFLYNQQ
jgi:hypothetical protein